VLTRHLGPHLSDHWLDQASGPNFDVAYCTSAHLEAIESADLPRSATGASIVGPLSLAEVLWRRIDRQLTSHN